MIERKYQLTKIKDLREGMVTPWYVILSDPVPHPTVEGMMQMWVRYSDTETKGLCRGLTDEEVPAL